MHLKLGKAVPAWQILDHKRYIPPASKAVLFFFFTNQASRVTNFYFTSIRFYLSQNTPELSLATRHFLGIGFEFLLIFPKDISNYICVGV